MKEVKAYIKPHKLSDVTLALHKVEGLTGMSVVDVRGFGRSRGENEGHRVVADLVDYVPHVKIEIICRDEMAEKVISVIENAAHTGLRGDGKIYVSSIEAAVRIETGERGNTVV